MEAVMALHQQKWNEERQLSEDLSYAWGLPNSHGQAMAKKGRRRRRKAPRRRHRKGPLGFVRETKAQRQRNLEKMAELLAKTPRKQPEENKREYGGVIDLTRQDTEQVRQTLAERTRHLQGEKGGQGEETTLRAVDSGIGDERLKELGRTTPCLKYAFLSGCNALSNTGLQNLLRECGNSLKRVVLYGTQWEVSKKTRQMAKESDVEITEHRTEGGRRKGRKGTNKKPEFSTTTKIFGKSSLLGRSVLSPFGGERESEDKWYVGKVEEHLGMQRGQRCYRVEYEDGENARRTEHQVLTELVPGLPEGHAWQESMTKEERRSQLRRASRGRRIELAKMKGGAQLPRHRGNEAEPSSDTGRRISTASGRGTMKDSGGFLSTQQKGGEKRKWLLELMDLHEKRGKSRPLSRRSRMRSDKGDLTLSSVEAQRRKRQLMTARRNRIEARRQAQEWKKWRGAGKKAERLRQKEKNRERISQGAHLRKEEQERDNKWREQRRERRERRRDGRGGRSSTQDERNLEADDDRGEGDDDDDDKRGGEQQDQGRQGEEDEDNEEDGGEDSSAEGVGEDDEVDENLDDEDEDGEDDEEDSLKVPSRIRGGRLVEAEGGQGCLR